MIKRVKANILGVEVDVISMAEAVRAVESFLKSRGGQYQVVTPNPEHIVLAQKDGEFKTILNKAALSVADGIGVVWASRILGGNPPIKERVTGTDLLIKLCELAAKKNWSVFLLGGEKGIAERAAQKLMARFLGLKIAGTSSADPVHLPTSAFQLPPSDLLFVAYGAPTQERWIYQNLHNLPVKVAMGVGGAFDFIAGKQRRAPNIFRELGLEWLWRLIVNPWRIGRIVNAVLVFPVLVVKRRAKMVE